MNATDERQTLRIKRTQVLVGTWKALVAHNKLDPERLKLSAPLTNEVIEYYLADNSAIKARYKISGRIQLHKVAGLMTAAILRFRPIIPLVDEYESYFRRCTRMNFSLYFTASPSAESSRLCKGGSQL